MLQKRHVNSTQQSLCQDPSIPLQFHHYKQLAFFSNTINKRITFTIYLGGFLPRSLKIQCLLNIAFALSQIISQKSVWKFINKLLQVLPPRLICDLMYFFLTQYRRIVIIRTHFYRDIIRVSIMILCDKTKCRRI